MKKILLVIFLTLPNIAFAERISGFRNSDGGEYAMCSADSTRRLVNCVNAVLEKGEYQLYGYPFGADEKYTKQTFLKK